MTTQPLIFVTRGLPPAVNERLLSSYRAKLNPDDAVYSAEEIVEGAEDCQAIICTATERLSADLIDRLPESIRMIATFSVGCEHIDLQAAQRRGIKVSNTPEVLTDATADIAMLCLLGAARRAYEGQTMLRGGNWSGWTATQLTGVHVTGKRLGILGMGRIGQALARRAKGFDMTVYYYNRSRLAPESEFGAIFCENAEEMLPRCDFLSLNAPASPETYHWLNAERIAALPDGAVVINTARGTLVDDDALIAALGSGKLAAAGLDVFEGEPNIDPRYFSLVNAFLLPHMGSATVETRNAMGFKCLDNLDAFFAGKALPDGLV